MRGNCREDKKQEMRSEEFERKWLHINIDDEPHGPTKFRHNIGENSCHYLRIHQNASVPTDREFSDACSILLAVYGTLCATSPFDVE